MLIPQIMTKFDLPFDLSNYGLLDQIALLACQSYNLGNSGDWFGAFRGGLYGFHSRIHGLITHYLTVHEWLPTPRIPSETEYHLASIFFNMDSAVECLTFSLNALGYASAPSAFRDVCSEKALKQISPKDILGEPSATPPRHPISGYEDFFPKLQTHWQAHRKLLSIIIEQHDVSKHRETIFTGGMSRLDPPPGFYEALGIGDDPAARSMFWPMAEIILRNDPKAIRVGREPQEMIDSILLETVVPDFCNFINESGKYLLQDAQAHIKLTHSKFIQSDS